MQAKKLKEILNTNYTIQETEDKICISSYYVTDLIAVNKKTLDLTYAMDTFHEGRNALKSEELERIWDKLSEIIKDKSIEEIIEKNDSIEGMKEFWYYDNQTKTIIKSYTDEYGWPNVDYTGKLIYDNNCFTNKQDAINYGINTLISNLKSTQEFIISETERFNEKIKTLNNEILTIQEGLSNLLIGIYNEKE